MPTERSASLWTGRNLQWLNDQRSGCSHRSDTFGSRAAKPFAEVKAALGKPVGEDEDSSSGAHRLRASDATTAVETTETTRVGDTYAVAEAVAALVLAISAIVVRIAIGEVGVVVAPGRVGH